MSLSDRLYRLAIRSIDIRLSNHEADSLLGPIINSPRKSPDIEAIILGKRTSDWSISDELCRFLHGAVQELGLRNVLEFGAGLSSLVLATSLAKNRGGRLTSVEQNPGWCKGLWKEVLQRENVNSIMVESRPRLAAGWAGLYYSFKEAGSTIAARGPYDLVLVDAPQWFYGRDGTLHQISGHLADNALIVLDDVNRDGEKWTLFRWLQTYEDLELAFYDPFFGGKGVALLFFRGNNRRLSGAAVLSGVFQILRSTITRRRLKKAGSLI